MNKKRSKTITIILVIMIFGLIGTIFYITNILLTPDATKSKIAARKSKAADITYSKDISLDQSKGQCTDDVKQCPDGSYVRRITPNCEFAACAAIQPVPTSNEEKSCADDIRECPDGSNVLRVLPNCEFAACPDKPSPTIEIKVTVEPTSGVGPTTETNPSPTSIVLADNSSNSQQSSESTYNSSTSSSVSTTVTPITSLPQTGLVNNSIIVFGLSSLLLFFAFLF